MLAVLKMCNLTLKGCVLVAHLHQRSVQNGVSPVAPSHIVEPIDVDSTGAACRPFVVVPPPFEVRRVELSSQLEGEVTDEFGAVGDDGLVEVGCIPRAQPTGLEVLCDRSQSFAHRLLAKLENIPCDAAGQQPVLRPEVHINGLEVTG